MLEFFTVVLVLLSFYGIVSLVKDFKPKFIKAKPKTEVKLLPHEILPELLHWEVGDEILQTVKGKCDACYDRLKIYSYSREGIAYSRKLEGQFLGIVDGKICINFPKTNEIKKVDPAEFVEENLANPDGKARAYDFEVAKVSKNASEDSYNEMLLALKEVNQKFLNA